MKRLVLLTCALSLFSCSPAQPRLERILYVPSSARVLAAGDAETVLTTWLPLGMSFETAGQSILYGLLLSRAPLVNDAYRPTGVTLPDRSRVRVSDATAWEKDGGRYRRLYRVSAEVQGTRREGFIDSSVVALITAETGALAAGFLERKITVSGGDSQYNVLAISDNGAVTLIDTSALVFPDSFHPSGAVKVSITDVNADGVPEIVLDADTIVSLQFLGSSPLRWQAWLQEKKSAWQMIFRFNESYGTDQGNSYIASRRAFSTSGSGLLDTVKVTTDSVETTQQGEFHTTITTFFTWDGSAYHEDSSQELPREGKVIPGTAQLLPGPGAQAAPVETLHSGDMLFLFDRSDTPQAVGGTKGFWYHAVTRSGKQGWVHAGGLKVSEIDSRKENRESFLGHSPFTSPVPLSP